MPEDGYLSKFRATLIGAAIADALSFPFKDYSRIFLRSLARPITDEYTRHADGLHVTGQYTDDTQSCVAVIGAILEAGKIDCETVADYLVPLWRDLTVVDPDHSLTRAMRPLVKGVTDWHDSGLDSGHAESGAVSRAIPVGLWDAYQPERIPSDAEAAMLVTHTDPRVLGAAAGIAAVIAHNLTNEEIVLGVLLDSIAGAVGRFHGPLAEAVEDMPHLLCQTETRAGEIIESKLADESYPAREDGLGDYVVPVFLYSLYQFLKAPMDFTKSVTGAITVGGNMGTTATLTGAFSGSHVGMDGIPATLANNLARREELLEAVDDFLKANLEAISAQSMEEGVS